MKLLYEFVEGSQQLKHKMVEVIIILEVETVFHFITIF